MSRPTPVPMPGSFGLSRIGGVTGWFVLLAQVLTGRVSKWTHAFLVLDGGEVIEAMPGGARIVPIADRLNHKEVVFCDAPIRRAVEALEADLRAYGLTTGHVLDRSEDYEDQLRAMVAAVGRGMEGTPYSFLNYPSMGLLWLSQVTGQPWLRPRWLRDFVADTGHLICSQLVDRAYLLAAEYMHAPALHLFVDPPRLSQDVAPGDLADYRLADLEQRAELAR